MSNILFIIFISLLIHISESFKCGSNKFEENIASSVVDMHCKGEKALINKCCLQHDRCYERQSPRKNCDQAFCDCLQTATKGNQLCQALGTSHMCNVVKMFGQTAYNNSKKIHSEKIKKTKKVKPEDGTEPEEKIIKKKKSKGSRKQKIDSTLEKEETEDEEILNTTEKI
uniref:Phospholipase A(2) n=1 Tax=Strongyloides venezuelensis TaxID=75913 RepID=A0A0K0EV43_STRVS